MVTGCQNLVSANKPHVEVSEIRSEKEVGDPLTQGRRIMGKTLGDEASPHITSETRGSRCLGPGEGERALSRVLGRAKVPGEGVLSMPAPGRHSENSRLTDAGPPALSPRGRGLWGAGTHTGSLTCRRLLSC